MTFLRRRLPLAITLIMGVTFALQYYIPHPVSEASITHLSEWMRIISGFALVLGLASLFQAHATKIRRQVPGWGYSVILYLAMLVTVVVGFLSKSETMVNGVQTGFGWIYTYTMVPLQATMFSILAFFIASAAYRAFRARSREAGFLLAAAVIVMMGRVPLGQFLFPWSWDITQWLLNVINSAARRAILIGVSMGAVALSVKIILGYERSYLGGGKDQ